MTVRQLITELLTLPMDSRITAVSAEGVSLPIVGVDAGYQDSHARPVALVLGPDRTEESVRDRTLVELAAAWGE